MVCGFAGAVQPNPNKMNPQIDQLSHGISWVSSHGHETLFHGGSLISPMGYNETPLRYSLRRGNNLSLSTRV